MWSLSELERHFPDVQWLQPMYCSVPGIGEAYLCRICVANHGLSGRDIKRWPQTREEHARHIQEAHLVRRGG